MSMFEKDQKVSKKEYTKTAIWANPYLNTEE